MSDFTDDIDWFDGDDEDWYVVIEGDLLRETKKAWLLRVPDEEAICKDIWLPKSQVGRVEGEEREWVLPRWLADTHMLIYRAYL